MKSIKSFNVINKNVLVRCDFDVPLDGSGNIIDDFRIRQTLPTIQYLIDNKAKIILMSHLGKPDGEIIPELKLDKVAEKLVEYLNAPIIKGDDCVGPDIESQTNKLESGNILLLENLRFHKEETEGDLEFAKQLSYLCDIYINDDFSDCHKIYASIAGIPQYLPSGTGLLLEKEINNLDKVLKNPEKPLAVIVGGEMDETKLKFIDSISKTADWVLVSGVIKRELMEKKMLFKHQDKIIGPIGFMDNSDIDEETIEIFQEKIMQAKTIFWYGTLEKSSEYKYVKGDLSIAEAITKSKAFSVVGEEKTIEFLSGKNLISKFSHISLGKEALLQYLSGEELPGLVALK